MEDNEDQIKSVRLKIPPEARPFFGRVPIISSESKLSYWLLVKAFAGSIEPRDVMEWLIVRNLADLTSSLFLYRHVGPHIIDVARMEALASILRSLTPDASAARNIAKSWFADSKTKSKIADLFIEHKIDVHHIDSEAVRLHAHELERIERMAASLESRCRQFYRDLEIHRESVRFRAEIERSSMPAGLPYVPESPLLEGNQTPQAGDTTDVMERKVEVEGGSRD